MKHIRLFFWRLRYVFFLFWYLIKDYNRTLKEAFALAKCEFGCFGIEDIYVNSVQLYASCLAESEAEELYYSAMEEA